MKKIIVGLTIAMLAIGAAGCSKDKKAEPVAAPSAVETLTSVEANYQRDDPNASDPSTALTCKYVQINNNNGTYEIKKAEIKTQGRCNFDTLKGSATGAGSLSADKAAAIVSAIASDNTLPSGARDKRGCTAYNIRSTTRKVGLQDCSDNSGNADTIAKNISNILGL